MTQITQNRDSLKKNYYLARNKSEKWFFVPWDNDATFGMLWDGSPYTVTNCWDPEKNNLIRRLSELPATGFYSIAKMRRNELRSSLFTPEALIARFASYRVKSVPMAFDSENARTRNFIRWPYSGGAGVNNPELGELAYIENWITDRIAFLDAQIMAQPSADVEPVSDFGENPGDLHMFLHRPSGFRVGLPLVVALHGCTQTAADFDRASRMPSQSMQMVIPKSVD